MKNKTREQLLVKVITLLDDARLGDRHETVLSLLHGARLASRDRDCLTAGQKSIEALGQLRKARNSLRVHDAPEQNITLITSAIDLLHPVQEEARADMEAMWAASSLEWRYLFLAVGAVLALTVLLLGRHLMYT